MSRLKCIWIRKIFIYVAGLFALALGIALSVKSDLGVSPVSSVPFVLAKITGSSLGTATVIIYILNLVIQASVLRRDYKPVNLLQIAVSFLFGYFTDATLRIVALLPVTDNYFARFVFLAFGIGFVALGVFFYLTASIMALPTDGAVQAITLKGRFKLHNVKVGYDCVSTALAILLSLIFLRGFEGIGIGTVAAALGVGRLLGIFSKLLKVKLLAFINGAAGKETPQAETLCADQQAVKAG